MTLRQCGHSSNPGSARRVLRLKVASSLLRRSNIGENQVQYILTKRALLPQANRRNSQSLLEDLRCISGDAPRALSPNVSVVGPRGCVSQQPPAEKHRSNERHIG